MTSKRPQERRTRGGYGTPSAADARFAAPDAGYVPSFNQAMPTRERGPGPFDWRCKVAPYVGVKPGVPGSGRTACFVLRYEGTGSLWIRKSRWTLLNESEFERLKDDVLVTASWRDENNVGWAKCRRRFVFEAKDGDQWVPVELPEPADVMVDEAAA